MANLVVISIGSNIDADNNIKKALKELSTYLTIIRQHPFIITSPIGIKDQPDFTNGAILCHTNLEMIELQKKLKHSEDFIGRDRSRDRFGPREIDLDIVAWNGTIVDKDYYTRQFLKEMTDELLK